MFDSCKSVSHSTCNIYSKQTSKDMGKSALCYLVLIVATLLSCATCQELPQPGFQLLTLLHDDLKVNGENDSSVQPFASLACALSVTNVQSFDSRWFYNGDGRVRIQLFNSLNPRFIGIQKGEIAISDIPGTTLIVGSLSYKDSGLYTCEVRQTLGQQPITDWASNTINLTLIVRLQALQSIVSTFNDSQHVRLGCDMAGYIRPDDQLYWLLEDIPLDNSTKYEVTYRDGLHISQLGGINISSSRVSELTIFDVDLEDARRYSCAINGTDKVDHLQLNVSIASNPSGHPLNIFGTAQSSTQIEVAWNEIPENERNGNVTHYEVQYVHYFLGDEVLTESVTTSGPVLRILLSDLDKFVEYNISVRGYTVVGPGPFSKHVSARTQEDSPAGYPENLQATTISATEIEVSWNEIPERERNGIITHYQVEYNQSQSSVLQSQVTDNLTIILTDLEAFTKYSIRVSAFSSVGGSPYSPVVSAITREASPSAAPDALTVVNFNKSSLGLTWETPPDTHINGLLRLYIIKYCALTFDDDDDDDDGDGSGLESGSGEPDGMSPTELPIAKYIMHNCSMVNVPGDTTRLIVTKLLDNTTYSISVAAYTIGAGPFVSKMWTTGDIAVAIEPGVLTELGPDNVTSHITLSCAVNTPTEETFIWEWIFEDQVISTEGNENLILNVNDSTQSSYVDIRKISYTKAKGSYECRLMYDSWKNILVGSNSTELDLKFAIEALSTDIVVLESQLVVLVCIYYGYTPTNELKWYKEKVDPDKETNTFISEISVGITHSSLSDKFRQFGMENPGMGSWSQLTITTTSPTDSGTFFCAVSESDILSGASIHVSIISQPGTPPIQPDPDTAGVIVGVLVGIVALLTIVVALIAAVIIGALLLRRRKRSKSYDPQALVSSTDGTVTASQDLIQVQVKNGDSTEGATAELMDEEVKMEESDKTSCVSETPDTNVTEETPQEQPKLELSELMNSDEPAKHVGSKSEALVANGASVRADEPLVVNGALGRADEPLVATGASVRSDHDGICSMGDIDGEDSVENGGITTTEETIKKQLLADTDGEDKPVDTDTIAASVVADLPKLELSEPEPPKYEPLIESHTDSSSGAQQNETLDSDGGGITSAEDSMKQDLLKIMENLGESLQSNKDD